MLGCSAKSNIFRPSTFRKRYRMTAESKTSADRIFTEAPITRTRIECAGTWAGSERSASLVELPGMLA